jgi:hypothetical protein
MYDFVSGMMVGCWESAHVIVVLVIQVFVCAYKSAFWHPFVEDLVGVEAFVCIHCHAYIHSFADCLQDNGFNIIQYLLSRIGVTVPFDE